MLIVGKLSDASIAEQKERKVKCLILKLQQAEIAMHFGMGEEPAQKCLNPFIESGKLQYADNFGRWEKLIAK
jgi:hypothetical protein